MMCLILKKNLRKNHTQSNQAERFLMINIRPIRRPLAVSSMVSGSFFARLAPNGVSVQKNYQKEHPRNRPSWARSVDPIVLTKVCTKAEGTEDGWVLPAAYLHAGLLHIVLNLLAMVSLGPFLERHYGLLPCTSMRVCDFFVAVCFAHFFAKVALGEGVADLHPPHPAPDR